MSKKIKITDEQRKKIFQLFSQGKSIRFISTLLGISYISVWLLTSGKQKGFDSLIAYLEYNAQKKGFRSYKDYKKILAFQRKSSLGRIPSHQKEQQYFEQSLVFLPLETIESLEEQGLLHQVSFYRPSLDDYIDRLEGLSLVRADIMEALGSLSDLERDVIERFYAGETLHKIQKTYSLHYETVRNIKEKGIKKLKIYLLKKIHERIA